MIHRVEVQLLQFHLPLSTAVLCNFSDKTFVGMLTMLGCECVAYNLLCKGSLQIMHACMHMHGAGGPAWPGVSSPLKQLSYALSAAL